MRPHAALLAAWLLLPAPAEAQAPVPADDLVLARIDGDPLTLSQVIAGAEDVLPPELRTIPPAQLMAMMPPDFARQLIDRAISERAIILAARRIGLDKDPEVSRRMRRAEEQELQQAFLTREIAAAVTDAALRARFDQEAANRTGDEEIQARHILVPTEAAAREALAEARRPGADFAEIAKRRSTGPGAAQGGDLGFFKRGDMVPEFAEAAFALQPGQISPAPVRSPFGWHVIRVEARRAAPAPDFDAVRDALRRRMMEEQVQTTVQRIRAAATVERLDQPPARSLLDNAAPPAAPQPQRR